MSKHLIIFVIILSFAAALIGCGGSGGGSSRQIGTTDNRILGSWRAREIRFAGQTASCPGEITSGDDSVSCNNNVLEFLQSGNTNMPNEQFYFNGQTLTMYASDGQSLNFQVSFNNSDNTMNWTFSEDGRTAVLVVDRVLL